MHPMFVTLFIETDADDLLAEEVVSQRDDGQGSAGRVLPATYQAVAASPEMASSSASLRASAKRSAWRKPAAPQAPNPMAGAARARTTLPAVCGPVLPSGSRAAMGEYARFCPR